MDNDRGREMLRTCICECESFFDEKFDGTLHRVAKVLYICQPEDDPEEVLAIFNPARYEDYYTVVRAIPSDKLDEVFR